MDVSIVISECVFFKNGIREYFNIRSEGSTEVEPKDAWLPEAAVVHLPRHEPSFLSTLNEIIKVLNESDNRITVVFVTDASALLIAKTLTANVKKKILRRNDFIIAPVSCTVENVDKLLKRGSTIHTCLMCNAFLENVMGKMTSKGMSSRELQVLINVYRGKDMRSQASETGLSIKSLYNYRLTGMKKFKRLGIETLATDQTSGIICDRHFNCLSENERRFVNAVAADDIFMVFQPIVNHNLRLQGFELLVRWVEDAAIKYPGDFLPGLRSKYPWMVLTAFALRHAIKMIKRYQGRYYFSVNLPNQLIHEQGLVNMLAAARSSLTNQTCKSLVLEINEKTSFEHHPEVIDNINSIQNMGYRVFLDDCFSAKSAFFPVRDVKFDGYKIDISAVNDSLHDFDCLALIQSLQHYCSLTNRKCIAEGIDRIEKINCLRHLSVLDFQGALISKPLKEEAMDQFIQESNEFLKPGISLAG
ncbi:EAL domain-containing protein [Enterobacter sp. SAT-E-asb]|uniref:EAL domain-containing protein n=1 Tax=unclassified Enterobacter TaxID=2608935 RepID=UPI00353195B7|nr:EAL domain-containing protein [Enterobacter asburiae]